MKNAENEGEYKFEIVKNIPVMKEIRNIKKIKFPLDRMEVGDSFEFPKKVKSSLHKAVMKVKDKKYTMRNLKNGYFRIWRTQ